MLRLALLFFTFFQMSIQTEQPVWPRVHSYASTIIDFPIQQVNQVLRDFGHWDKWYSQDRHQENLNPPPYDAVGSKRAMFNEGKTLGIWQELVDRDDDHYTLAYSVLPYTPETEKYRAVNSGYDERSDMTVYPITTDGNYASLVEWSINQNTDRTFEALDKVNQYIFSTVFKDLEDYLEKNSPKQQNSIYSVKYLDGGKFQLTINQGSILQESSGDLSSKIKSYISHSKDITLIKENPTQATRENAESSSFDVSYGDDHKASFFVRPVTIAVTGQALRLAKAKVNTYVQIQHTIILPSRETIEETVASIQKQFQEFITSLPSVQKTEL
jgi:hypothetical protein